MTSSLGGGYTGYRVAKELANLLRAGLSYMLPKRANIAITGMQGAGKSVLYDYLSGRAYKAGYQPPLQSQHLEKSKMKHQGKKLLVSVIPGQSEGAAPRLEAIDTVFGTSKTVDLLIHVVAFGYAVIRSAGSAGSLIKDFKVNTIAKYRKYSRERELADLAETCKAIRLSQRKNRSPRQLIVAVDKVDLYPDEIDKALAYYQGASGSPFVQQLRELERQVGTDHFAWEARPVCAQLEDFRWHRQSAASRIDAEARDQYVADFLRLIASHLKKEGIPMPDDNKKEVSQRKTPRLVRDAGKLLALAERLQEQTEANERRVDNLSILIVCLLAAGSIAALWLGFLVTFTSVFNQLMIASAVFIGDLIIVVQIAQRFAAMRKKIATDKRALFEIADMLRDVEGKIARKFGLSMIERAEIRIRLSRLGIGTGLDNNILGDDALHQSPAERQARQAGLMALKALNGQTLSENERAQLPSTVLAFLILQGMLIPTEYERSKLNIDELLLLACRGKVQLTPQEMNQMSEEQRAILLKGTPQPAH